MSGQVAAQQSVDPKRTLARRWVRIFAAPAGEPRIRRATDVLLVVGAVGGLILLVVAYPPSAFEHSFQNFLDNTPGWLDPVWEVVYDLLWLWAMLLVLAALVARRTFIAVQAAGALVLGTLLAYLAARWALGHWPAFGSAIEGASDSPAFPAMRVAETGAVILVVGPHLVSSLRLTGRWILFLGILGGTLIDPATPGGNLAGFLIAVTAAAAVRLALGTSAGRPGLPDVDALLAELGVQARDVKHAERQVAGVATFTARDPSGADLVVKVYGQDAYDNALLSKLWRTLMYRNGGAQVGLSRLQAVEHEALMTLLAARAGVRSREVVAASQTAEGDAVLVLRGTARPLAELSVDDLGEQRLGTCWQALSRLAAGSLAHLAIDQTTVAFDGDDVLLLDFGAATAAPTEDQLWTDRVQLLAATAAAAGSERGIAATLQALGPDGVEKLLPYLQSAALATPLRKSVRQAGINVDELRADLATAAGATVPDLIKLRRMTWWTVIQAVLLVFAFGAVYKAAAGVDWSVVREDLSNANWWWIALGFVLAQLPRLAQAVAMLGSVAARLPFWPVYIKELATCYLNLAMPSSIARMALSIRFFQCQGLPGVVAVTSGAIDSLANNVIQVMIVVVLLIFGQSTVDLNLSAPGESSGPGKLLWILLGLLVVSVLVVVFVGRVRRPLVERFRKWWPEIRNSITGLRGAKKLRLLILGNIAAELLFSASLGVFARSLGYHISYAEIVMINESVALLSSFIPVPGGIGVVEFGLSVGLTSAGMTNESALITVLLYRLSTFYLPPIWGFFAFRWLQRNKYL